jgi:hypothetical protein
MKTIEITEALSNAGHSDVAAFVGGLLQAEEAVTFYSEKLKEGGTHEKCKEILTKAAIANKAIAFYLEELQNFFNPENTEGELKEACTEHGLNYAALIGDMHLAFYVMAFKPLEAQGESSAK